MGGLRRLKAKVTGIRGRRADAAKPKARRAASAAGGRASGT